MKVEPNATRPMGNASETTGDNRQPPAICFRGAGNAHLLITNDAESITKSCLQVDFSAQGCCFYVTDPPNGQRQNGNAAAAAAAANSTAASRRQATVHSDEAKRKLQTTVKNVRLLRASLNPWKSLIEHSQEARQHETAAAGGEAHEMHSVAQPTADSSTAKAQHSHSKAAQRWTLSRQLTQHHHAGN